MTTKRPKSKKTTKNNKKQSSKPANSKRKLSAHKVSLTDKARKVVRAGIAELVDRSLLEIAAAQYSKLLRQLSRQRKRLDKDRQAALEVGERILERAKEVSASLVRK